MLLRLMPSLMIGIGMTNLSNVLLQIRQACGNASRQPLSCEVDDLASAALEVAVAALVAVLPLLAALFVQPWWQWLPCHLQ